MSKRRKRHAPPPEKSKRERYDAALLRAVRKYDAKHTNTPYTSRLIYR
jgi:hypothetical protein